MHRAKNEGYFGIKLYGTLDPAWVKPMADEAHKLGLHVHGHIPHGMRPLDAVRAGYDEITHINFVMMQAMPDDVVQQLERPAALLGPGSYAADVDIHSPECRPISMNWRRHIAVDPTLVTFEICMCRIAATSPPPTRPSPARCRRRWSAASSPGGVQPPPDLPRATMRKSYAKLQAAGGRT